MDPENFFAERNVMFNLGNFLFGLLLIGFCLIVFYAICKWCGENESETKPKPKQKESDRLMMKPVYAHEIEPGIVILQSEEGDYFKILKEYDSSKDNLYGSVSCTKPNMMQPEQDFTQSRKTSQTSLLASAPPTFFDP